METKHLNWRQFRNQINIIQSNRLTKKVIMYSINETENDVNNVNDGLIKHEHLPDVDQHKERQHGASMNHKGKDLLSSDVNKYAEENLEILMGNQLVPDNAAITPSTGDATKNAEGSHGKSEKRHFYDRPAHH